MSLSRARWLVAARRARFVRPKVLELLEAPANEGSEQRTHWSALSRITPRLPGVHPQLGAFRMNGSLLE